jgi:hypothetical protein
MPFLSQSPNRDVVEKIVSSINALGANRPNHPSSQERGLCLVIANKRKLETLEARRKALLRELDRIGEEITQTRVELDKPRVSFKLGCTASRSNRPSMNEDLHLLITI